MKIYIFGAGAVGSLLAGRMVRGGRDVTIITRGEHLGAIKENGLTIRDRDGTWQVEVKATSDADTLGQADFLILGLKAHTVLTALKQITPLVGPKTIIMPIVNGIPWWFFHGLETIHSVRCLKSIDPEGQILSTFGPMRALGCVVHIACSILSPGVVEHSAGGTFFIGEPNNKESDRLKRVINALNSSGFKIRSTTDIRSEIWSKLYANITGNPVSVLLEAGFEDIFGEPEIRNVLCNIIKETSSVASAFGSSACLDIDKRFDALAKLGKAKSSTLQDFESGKSLEIDALIGSVSELGRIANIKTPTIDLIYALTRQKAKIAGLYSH